jgi:hypothetical protein
MAPFNEKLERKPDYLLEFGFEFAKKGIRILIDSQPSFLARSRWASLSIHAESRDSQYRLGKGIEQRNGIQRITVHTKSKLEKNSLDRQQI